MKLVDDRGRLFGKVNLIDLLLILALLAAAAGILWKIFAPVVTSATAQTVKATMICRVRAVSPRAYESIKDHVEMQLIAGNDVVADAHVVGLAVEPYRQQVPTADGRLVDAEDPVRLDLLFTIEAQIANTSILRIGTQEVRVGIGHFVKTTMYEFGSTIESLVLS